MGEEETTFLAGWLNSRKGTKPYGRLLRLLTDLRELSRLSPVAQYANEDGLKRLLARAKSGSSGRGHIASISLQDLSSSPEYVRRLRLLDGHLARYKVRPRLTLTKAPLFAESGRARHLWEWHGKNSETDAAVKLLDLERQGLLDRVRQCQWKPCGKWFFARFRHQCFSTQKCQLRAYQQSDQFKEYRRQLYRSWRRQGEMR